MSKIENFSKIRTYVLKKIELKKLSISIKVEVKNITNIAVQNGYNIENHEWSYSVMSFFLCILFFLGIEY